jgi:G:T-mismatch repair DNA endonuclease (very short patch repair protein)
LDVVVSSVFCFVFLDGTPWFHYEIGSATSPATSAKPWPLTCVYGEAQIREHHKTWDTLKFIKSSSDLQWMCIGDFNKVLRREEHVGVNKRCRAQIAAFCETVDICGLVDLVM